MLNPRSTCFTPRASRTVPTPRRLPGVGCWGELPREGGTLAWWGSLSRVELWGHRVFPSWKPAAGPGGAPLGLLRPDCPAPRRARHLWLHDPTSATLAPTSASLPSAAPLFPLLLSLAHRRRTTTSMSPAPARLRHSRPVPVGHAQSFSGAGAGGSLPRHRLSEAHRRSSGTPNRCVSLCRVQEGAAHATHPPQLHPSASGRITSEPQRKKNVSMYLI